MAESKAFMRAIRAALGLAGTYKLPDLKKPFIVARVVPNLDAPEIKQAVAGSYLQSMGLLFETPAAPMQAALPPAQQAEEVPPYEDEGCEAPPPPEDYEEPDTGWQEPYYEEPPAPHQQPQPGIYCADCRKEITAVNTRNGAVWTPDDIAGYSQRVFGRILCNECQRKARGGRK